MNSNSATRQLPPKVVARNISDVAHDVVTLGELQWELLKAETGLCVKRSLMPALLLVVAGVLMLGCIPVLLFSLGQALAMWLDWSLAAGYGIAGLAAVLVAALLAMLSWQRLKNALNAFHGTREELQQNVTWIKQVFTETSRCQEELR